MWEINKAFEASLRGGMDVSLQPKPSKSELVKKHHKSCTGAFHGSGVEKMKSSSVVIVAAGERRCCHQDRSDVKGSCRPTSLDLSDTDSVDRVKTSSSVATSDRRCCSDVKSSCRPTSLDLSDTDSGQESLVSPLRTSKTESLDEDHHDEGNNGNCCECSCHCVARTKSNADPLKSSCTLNDISEEDMLKRLQALNNSDEEGDNKKTTSTLAMESIEQITNRLSLRRKKRNQRIAEHVDGSVQKVVGPSPEKSAGKKVQGSASGVITENGLKSTKVTKVVAGRKTKAAAVDTDNNAKRPDEKSVKEGRSVEKPEGDDGGSRKPSLGSEKRPEVARKTPLKTPRRVVGVKAVVTTPPPPPPAKSVALVKKNSRGDLRSASVKSAVSPPGKGSVGRRPPGVVRGFLAGVPKVEWAEVYDQAVNRKPGGSGTGLYRDLHEAICDSLLNTLMLEAKSEEQLATERAWLEAERLWLVHRAGFTASRRLEEQEAAVNGELDGGGRVTIRLEGSGDVLTVEDDDVEKANPPQFDRVEDLGHLRYLNESSVLHTLRQRYASNLIHTYAGSSLLVINPMAPLAIYSDKVVHMFRGCKTEDMPPHIYSLAQSAYRGMLASRRDQAIVLHGRSASGKTTNFKHILHYLMLAAGSVNKIITIEKLNAIGTVLEAFGNARTRLNANATRFTQIFSLDFDQSGQISSASIQVLLVERSRVAHRPEGEASFHILYQLLAGVEGQLRKHLHLEATPLSEPNLFVNPLTRHEDKQKAMLEFGRVSAAMKVIGVSEMEARAVWSVLAAIFHLGFAGAVRSGNSSSRWQFASPQSAQQAAHLLGTTVEELARYLFGQGAGGTPSTPRAPFRTPSPTEPRGLDVTGLEALEGMVIGLYGEVFNAVAALINRSISTPIHTVSSLIVVDAPGFQNPASCGHQGGATFEDLCHNYLQERLQLLFHHTTLTAPRDRYIQEHIDCQCDDDVDTSTGPGPLVSLLDRAAQSAIVRTSQTDLRDIDRRGLLWLLDEQAVFPYASEEAFLERLFQHYSDREHQILLRKAPGHNQFILQHLQGTNPVLYSATGWLKASRENPVAKTVVSILQESNKEEISQLFVSCRGSGVSGGSIVGIEGTQSLRRASSIRRTFTTGAAGIKRKSLCLQVKFTVDGLVETLRRTRLKFVHCLLPQHTAGLTGLRTSLLKNGSADDDLLNIPLLRSQLRGSQLIPAVRLHKQGFPKLLPLPEFRRRFRLLSPAETRPVSPVPDERRAVEDMLIGMDMDLASYRVGLSQIFFRSGVLAGLEAQRDERLTEHVVKLQSRCRGYLARRKLAKLRLQDVAMRCIQRNVRKLLAVQDWPWWKLLMKVTPLLNVHRTEEELKVKTEELDTLRSKVDKLESERSQLQHDNDKLGAKLSEMTADLAEEHSTSTLATERLEAETSERLRLERELQEIQVQHSTLSATSERLETELLYLRAVDAPSEDEEGAGDAGVYKQRYERVLRELEFTKHRLQQQHEDDLEQLVALKKQLEKKLSDAYEEVQEQRQVAGQWKRKVQKLQAETNDLRLLSEEQNSRNTLLEKKQRKFDSEFQLLQEQYRQEKQQRDRSSREREMALGEKYTLEQNLSATRLELELKEEQVNSLTRELDDLVTGGHTDLEVASLKRSKNELEKKLQEQEEELDDLAGQLAMLGQAKLRLEMNLEQQRKEARREASQRDEELEDVRCNATKKVKALESQLESEHEERTLLLREKHELERRASAAEDAAGRSQAERDQVARLKRDLRRTRALLRDAHLVMQKNSGDASAKTLVRQLRNQLEDLELARASAVKGKQTAEAELSDVQAQLEEASRGRSDAEERAASASRQGQELRTQLDENEEELAEVLKKYRGCVQQLSTEQLAQQEQAAVVAQLEQERTALRDQLSEMTARLECVETLADPGSSLAQRRLELKTREMESRLELEQTTRARLEVQISRLKDAVEKLQSEASHARAKEQSALGESRKVSRSLREARDEVSASVAREAEATQRRKEAETRLEVAQAETLAARADLRLALTRINDLQAAIQDDCSQTESDHESESDESIESFLVNNDTSVTWDRSRVSLNRSPPRRSPSSDFDSKSTDLPKTISDSTTKESYA